MNIPFKSFFFVLVILLTICSCEKSTQAVQNTHMAELSEMVLIDGGEFYMGAADNTGDSDEYPYHRVILDTFYMGKYELSQIQYETVMGTNPSVFVYEDFPVENIDWDDAIEFCNQLSLMENRTPCYDIDGSNVSCNFNADGYRLPTEAEWEYAARGGQKSNGYKYSGSDNADEVAWYNNGFIDSPPTHKVGSKLYNELGLYDMSGNVWEWCWDRYDRDYYAVSPTHNPAGPDSGIYYIIRGGSYHINIRGSRCTNRNFHEIDFGNSDNGFRIVRKK